MRILAALLLLIASVAGGYFAGYLSASKDICFAESARFAMQNMSTIQYINEGRCRDAADLHNIELEKNIARLQSLYETRDAYAEFPGILASSFQRFHLNLSWDETRSEVLDRYLKVLHSKE